MIDDVTLMYILMHNAWIEGLPKCAINAPDTKWSDDTEWMKKMARQTMRMIESLNDPEWADGKHFGDCTNYPMTCMRCLIDGFKEEAGELMAMLKEGEL